MSREQAIARQKELAGKLAVFYMACVQNSIVLFYDEAIDMTDALSRIKHDATVAKKYRDMFFLEYQGEELPVDEGFIPFTEEGERIADQAEVELHELRK